MKSISITIPLTHSALTRASDMLHGLAIDASKETNTGHERAEALRYQAQKHGRKDPMFSPEEIEQATYHANNESEGRTAWQDHIDEQAEAAEVFASPKTGPALTVTEKSGPVAASGPEVFADPKTAAAPAGAPVAEVPQATDQTQPHAASATETTPEFVDSAKEAGEASSGVELADGIPWDNRIHGSGRGKLAKAPHGWKKKRNVDPDLVIEVEAELRAAMSAGTAPAPASAPAPAPAPSSKSEPQAVPVDFTKLAPAEVTTFPALMAACTAKGLTAEQVLAAVNFIGLSSIPLLAARPDLIPAVAQSLGV